jgi:glutathione S-transferase
MKIYNNHLNGNFFVDVAVITANLADLPLEEVFVSEEDLKAKEWRLKSITGKCPTLETAEGNLVESAAIARYLGRLSSTHLSGSTPFEQAQVD